MTQQTQWHLSRDGNQSGPFSDGQLAKMAESGELLAHDLLWKPGYEGWIPASIIPGLLKPPPLPAGNTSAAPSPPRPHRADGAMTQRVQTIEQTTKVAKLLSLGGTLMMGVAFFVFLNSGVAAASPWFFVGLLLYACGSFIAWWKNA
jgi:hypothetical protein